jgi:anthranilate/para-aminobenzoate synthase component II
MSVFAIATVTKGHEALCLAIEHRTMPLSAVQFQPESILTSDGDLGWR